MKINISLTDYKNFAQSVKDAEATDLKEFFQKNPEVIQNIFKQFAAEIALDQALATKIKETLPSQNPLYEKVNKYLDWSLHPPPEDHRPKCLR